MRPVIPKIVSNNIPMELLKIIRMEVESSNSPFRGVHAVFQFQSKKQPYK